MSYTIKAVEVWAGDIRNRPGMLARVLEALSNAGASLEFIVARRVTDNTSRIFVAPLKGKGQKQAAGDVGLVVAQNMHALCVQGPNRAGLGAELARAIADAGINLRGLSAATIGKKAILYFGFRSADDSKAANRALKKVLRAKRSR